MLRKTLQTAVAALMLAGVMYTRAAIVTTWTQDFGSAVFTGANTSNPVLGDGSNNSADNIAVSGSLTGSLTANVGEAIQMTGSMTLVGISNNVAGEFGFGTFDRNGSLNATGWRGYLATNSDGTNQGNLWERNAGNTSGYYAATDRTSLGLALATPANPSFDAGTYSFSLALTHLANGSMNISYTLTRTGYSLNGNFNDPTPQTFTFDRVGFVVGNSLNADQFSLSNVNVSVVPEPCAAVLLPPCITALFALRRRSGTRI